MSPQMVEEVRGILYAIFDSSSSEAIVATSDDCDIGGNGLGSLFKGRQYGLRHAVVTLERNPLRMRVVDAVTNDLVGITTMAPQTMFCCLASGDEYIVVVQEPETLNLFLKPETKSSKMMLHNILSSIKSKSNNFTSDGNIKLSVKDSISESVSKWENNTPCNEFDRKTDQGSAELYFHYYGMLQHQQNMLQDYIRTGTYFSAITENSDDFRGKAVLDVGCGSGILSLFAAQAGARVVYAIEASGMAHFAQKLAASNPSIGNRIKILHCKVEEAQLPEKVDILISEPMGTLLVNERMLETYIYARKAFMKPRGQMYPRIGRIHLAAFSDPVLHAEMVSKSFFWNQNNFYGVDLTCLEVPATSGYFSQVVVDAIPPNVLISNCASKAFDFSSCNEEELEDIEIPISLQVAAPCVVHGIASWFDVLFDGTTNPRYLSTAPGLPTTHWFQLRFVLEQPISIYRPGETISGVMNLKAHSRQSYDIFLTLKAPGLESGSPPQVRSAKFDLKDPYYRQLVTGTSWWNSQSQENSNGFQENSELGKLQQVHINGIEEDNPTMTRNMSSEDLLPI